MPLNLDDAIVRLKENEARVDIWANQAGPYTTNEATPRSVESIPTLMDRLRDRYLTLVSRGNWATATVYSINDLVFEGGSNYLGTVGHTSGVFATDLAAGKWVLYHGNADTVATLAELKAAPITTGIVAMLGRTTAGDDGSGFYVWLEGDYSAQVADDPDENDYVARTGTPVTTGVFARLSTPIPRAFNIGTLPVDLDTWIRKGQVHLQGQRICKADGVTSDSENITSLITEMSAAGGGRIFAESTNSFYNVTNRILIKSGVSIIGLGKSSRFVNSRTAQEWDIFLMGSMNPSNLPSWTFHAVSAISAPTRILTLTTPLAGSVYTVGAIIMVRSNDNTNSDPNIVKPSFVNLCKITAVAVNGLGETTALTLEYPIEYDVAVPLIGTMDGQVAGNYVCDSSGIHNLRLYSEVGRGIIYQALYNGHISNIYHEKSRYILNGNGLSRSLIENVRGLYTDAVVEFAIGSHDSTIKGIRAACYPDPPATPTTVSSIIKIGEFVYKCRMTDFQINAYGWAPADYATSSAIGFISAAVDTEISNGRILSASAFNGVDFPGVNFPSDVLVRNSGNSVKNVEIRGAFDRYFTYSGSNNVPVNCDILDSKFYGAQSDQSRTNATASGKLLRNYFEQGRVNLASPDIEFRENSVYAFQTTNAPLKRKLSGNTRHSWKAVHVAAVWLNDVAVTTTVANTVVPGGSLVVPTGLQYQVFDQFMFYASGDAAGAVTKEIRLVDDTGALLSVSMLTTETGAFVISGRIQMHGDVGAIYSMDAEYSVLQGLHAVPVRVRRTGLNLPTNGRTFSLQAWLGGAGTITFDRVEIKPVLVGE